MAERFTRLILELTANPKVLSQYQDDPDAFLSDKEVSIAERTLLESGNAVLIRDAIIADLSKRGPSPDIVTITVITIKITRTHVVGQEKTRRFDIDSLTSLLRNPI